MSDPYQQGYDEGYYHGLKDAIMTLILMSMRGDDLNAIREELVSMRENSKEIFDNHFSPNDP